MLKGTVKYLIPKMLNLPEDKEYELKEYKCKRSLKANAYYHTLKDQICDKMNLNKEEQHFKYLKEYGQGYTIPFPASKDIRGLIKYYEKDGHGTLEGVEVNFYKVYKPSSEMDSKEFWTLIKGVEQDAKALGIQTLDDKELEQYIKWMEEGRKKK